MGKTTGSISDFYIIVILFDHFYAFDSTTITLFQEIMKGAGRNPKREERGCSLSVVGDSSGVIKEEHIDLKNERTKILSIGIQLLMNNRNLFAVGFKSGYLSIYRNRFMTILAFVLFNVSFYVA